MSEIKQIYYRTTKATIGRDLARAIDLLKSLPTDEDRQRAAVYMDGLSQMRSDWAGQAHSRKVPGRRKR